MRVAVQQLLLGQGAAACSAALPAAIAAGRRTFSVATGATGAAGEDDTQQRTTETSSLVDRTSESDPASDASGASSSPPPPQTMTGERVFESGKTATAQPAPPSKRGEDPLGMGADVGSVADEERIGEEGSAAARPGGAVGAAVDAVKSVGHKVADAARHATETVIKATSAAPLGDTASGTEVWEGLQKSQADPGAGVDGGSPAAQHGGGREGGKD